MTNGASKPRLAGANPKKHGKNMTTHLREKWKLGTPTLNGWCSIGNPFTAEIMAAQGYDWGSSAR